MHHEILIDQHGPHGPPMVKAIQTCVHCGFCLAACPTYRLLGQEMDSPRGRIVLMKEVLEGHLQAADAAPHIDACLGCLACEPACPSGVAYRDLISPYRALATAKQKRSLLEKLKRKFVLSTLPYPRRFRMATRAARLARPFGRWFPKSLRPMVDLLPDRLPPKQSLPETVPAIGERRARVALLVGCAQQVLDPDINVATVDVLTRNGVEVVIPAGQSCCGGLSWHVGNLKQAQEFGKTNLEAFPSDVDAIVTNAAGCGSAMQEYDLILKGTEAEQLATDFSQRVCDVSVFLDRLGDLQPIPDSGKSIRIAYHDACHLSHAQGAIAAPRRLLQMIPGVDLVNIPDAHLCCGSAGTYNLDQPELARKLGQQKVAKILSTNPDLIATGNIGCITQLNLHLAKQNANLPIRHTMQILRDAYEGAKSERYPPAADSLR